MTSFLRGILPSSSAKPEHDDDAYYNADYSFAMEYSGPPVSQEIPQVVPIDVRRIPTASVAARSLPSKDFSLPVIQPFVRSRHLYKKASEELKSGAEPQVSGVHFGGFGNSGRVYSKNLENCSGKGSALATLSKAQSSSSSSGTLGFSDGHGDSNHLSESSGVEDLDDECKAGVSFGNGLNPTVSPSKHFASRSHELSLKISSCQEVEDYVVETSSHRNRTSAVPFRKSPSSDAISEENDDDEPAIFAEKPVVSNYRKKGLCHRCHKRNRFAEKEACIVCCAKYCSRCVIRAMGSMPEGRKCINCIGYRINESKRGSLGKYSRMLKRLVTDDGVRQIMNAEILCKPNQLPPHLISVNNNRLSMEELVLLQSCERPPKKLRPGKYWYDKVSGFWGKEGEKPCQIISAELPLRHPITRDVSRGDTNIMINGRLITRAERWMLQAAGIHCEGSLHFWLIADGSYQHEGMKNVMGNLWKKRMVKIVCAALSLPFPSDTSNPCGEDAEKDMGKVGAKNLKQGMPNKLLLIGCDQSGTSTIYKQAKIVYNVPFSEDEKQNIKLVIQRNLYRYICILLEGHARFEEEYLIELKRRLAEEPGPSGIFERIEEDNIYSFSPKLKAFSCWLLQIMMTGNLEAIFPSSTGEYSPLVEELWKDKAFQATYKRRSELHMLPRVANYFLDRAVEISRVDYEPSQMDILYAEGVNSSKGVASMEFSFPNSPQHENMESSDQNNPPGRYQLIRVHESSLGENCKWLHMFEDVNLVLYCVSLTDYDEYYEDINGVCTNKMLATKKLFETIVTRPTFAAKDFLLILNKFDLLEEKIYQVPLSQCDWFRDFNPVISLHPHNTNSNNNPPLAPRAFHYIAVKFKRLFNSLTGRKLFVSRGTGLEADSIDKALRYGGEILMWKAETRTVGVNEWSTTSTESSTFVQNTHTDYL